MKCTFSEIKGKEIICVKTGTKLGYADDLEFDTDGMSVKALLIFGRCQLFGLLGRQDDIRVDADDIQLIGEDTVLIRGNRYISPKKDKIRVKSLS
ncbi:MAG: YlmC/YmxH family sporulation protein [Oscillospiraceae bacterium]|nr:YlmC/YmxH family sporulation protein [Oscillospiraceae bacterium]MDD7430010.1 YlmC/YmxH family sporulation protein [Oscillospiraceae bacterium]